MITIYGLVDPRDLCLRYVGKSKNPTKRLRSHLKEKGSTRKHRWLDQLRSLGIAPNMVVLESCDEANWQDRETRWIAFFKQPEWSGDRLCNHTDGGEGLVNPSAETRSKMSDLAKNRMADPVVRSKIYTESRSQNLSEALKGRAKSPEHVAALPQNQKGFRPNLTIERREQLSEQARSRNASREYQPHTDQTKKAISEKSKGNKSRSGLTNSPDMNRKISDSLKGKQKSPEHREKMKLAAQKKVGRKED